MKKIISLETNCCCFESTRKEGNIMGMIGKDLRGKCWLVGGGEMEQGGG